MLKSQHICLLNSSPKSFTQGFCTVVHNFENVDMQATSAPPHWNFILLWRTSTFVTWYFLVFYFDPPPPLANVYSPTTFKFRCPFALLLWLLLHCILSLSLYFWVKRATCQETISFFITKCLLLQWCLDNSRYSRGNEKVEIDIPLWLHRRHWKLTGLQTESGQKINTSIWASFPIGKVKGSGLRINLEYQNFACAALWFSNPIFKNLSKGDTQTSM